MLVWRQGLLEEIARAKRVSSRGKVNPRGVKRKMTGYNIRRRGAKLNQIHQFIVVRK
jgi:uncharacterized MAPEG superfamily protein